MILVDANILIYSHVSSLAQHDAARDWLDQQLNGPTRVGLPWESLLAFLRLADTLKDRLELAGERAALGWSRPGEQHDYQGQLCEGAQRSGRHPGEGADVASACNEQEYGSSDQSGGGPCMVRGGGGLKAVGRAEDDGCHNRGEECSRGSRAGA